MAKQLFGTDGIRGKVGGDLITPDNILKLGWAIGMVFAEKNPSETILIGKDTRISGYMLESALQAGIVAAGMNIGLLGPMPTPAIAYLTCTLRAAAGIVISASHNPFMDNGIKIFTSTGKKIDNETAEKISKYFNQPIKVTSSPLIGRAKRYTSAPARYIERCKSRFKVGDEGLSGLKIVIDCANGANYLVAPCVFNELGAETIILNDSPDGYNINKQSGALYPQKLAQQVLASEADCGIAFDGDGDRLIMVDHTGHICDGDDLLYVITKHKILTNSFSGGVIGTQMTNGALEKEFKKLKIPFERVQVGDKHIMSRLHENNWQIGGEPSGHLIDLTKTSSGDGIIAALQVLSAMIEQKSSLKALTASLQKSPQALINIDHPTNFDFGDNIDKIEKIKQDLQQSLDKNDRILIRASGTEALIRVFVEGSNPINVEQIAKKCVARIKDLF